jgi:hypothetical protein
MSLRLMANSFDAFIVGTRSPGIPDAKFDRQILAVFDKVRIDDQSVRDSSRAVLRSQTKDSQAESIAQRDELHRQTTLLAQTQDRLSNLRLAEEVDQDTYARKCTEIRDRLASITVAKATHPIEVGRLAAWNAVQLPHDPQ